MRVKGSARERKGERDGQSGCSLRGDREGRRQAAELLLGAVRVGDRCGQPDGLRIVPRDGNLSPEGWGIGGGVGTGPEGYEGHVTFYVGVPDIEQALQKAESLGGTRVMGPEKVMDQVELGSSRTRRDI
jgi:hypothetical protein